MARYPGARWRPVTRYLSGGSSCQAMSRYDAGVDHTYVGSPTADAAFGHFNVPGTATPHFMVFRDGTIDQYIDTRFRSSACLDGNPRLITWETADGFPSLWSNGQAPKDTPAMVQAKARLMVWLSKTHGIPLVRCPSSRPTARGFGWHRLGIDGNYEEPAGQLLGGRVSGGEHWSLSAGKTCPTSRRIHQFVEETLPAAVKLAKPAPPERPTRVRRRLVFHVHAPQFYYVEDSLRGMLFALAHLFRWIDWDIQRTKDGVLVVAHGPRPLSSRRTGGFHDTGKDPVDPIKPSDTYADLTWAQVQRLRSNDGKGYRVRRADELIPLALKKGLKVEAEAKTSAITKADWLALRQAIIDAGQDPDHMQAKAFLKFAPSLRSAHAASIVTIALIHTAAEQHIPTADRPFLDHYRGRRPIWT